MQDKSICYSTAVVICSSGPPYPSTHVGEHDEQRFCLEVSNPIEDLFSFLYFMFASAVGHVDSFFLWKYTSCKNLECSTMVGSTLCVWKPHASSMQYEKRLFQHRPSRQRSWVLALLGEGAN